MVKLKGSTYSENPTDDSYSGKKKKKKKKNDKSDKVLKEISQMKKVLEVMDKRKTYAPGKIKKYSGINQNRIDSWLEKGQGLSDKNLKDHYNVFFIKYNDRKNKIDRNRAKKNNSVDYQLKKSTVKKLNFLLLDNYIYDFNLKKEDKINFILENIPRKNINKSLKKFDRQMDEIESFLVKFNRRSLRKLLDDKSKKNNASLIGPIKSSIRFYELDIFLKKIRKLSKIDPKDKLFDDYIYDNFKKNRDVNLFKELNSLNEAELNRIIRENTKLKNVKANRCITVILRNVSQNDIIKSLDNIKKDKGKSKPKKGSVNNNQEKRYKPTVNSGVPDYKTDLVKLR
ncbi:MAG: hypothetical protein IKV87_01215 [Methanobrevibacter sp.]|nr:hypothetical protein [Methanobrevibacter sp.]